MGFSIDHVDGFSLVSSSIGRASGR